MTQIKLLLLVLKAFILPNHILPFHIESPDTAIYTLMCPATINGQGFIGVYDKHGNLGRIYFGNASELLHWKSKEVSTTLWRLK